MAKTRGDRNLILGEVDSEGFTWFDPAQAPMALSGFPWQQENGNYCRLPMRIMPQQREDLQWIAWQPAGGMIHFRSDSRRVAVSVRFGRREHFMHSNTHGQESGFDCYLGAGGRSRFHAMLAPKRVAAQQLYSLALPEGMQDIALYFPLLNPVKRISIGLDEGAGVLPPKRRRRGRICFYGSSITQGFCCSRPGLSYPAQVCRELDAELVNLGFGGNAKGDLDVADAIAELDLDAFVYDYDHNSPSVEWLQQTHEAFFKRIRRKRPELPILVMSSPVPWKNEAYFGKRAAIIERTVRRARKRGDRHVRFLAGRRLLPRKNWQDCTVDNLHPNDHGFHVMAAAVAAELGKLLAKGDRR